MAEQAGQQPQHHFEIQRIYFKDCSFETPNTPQIFQKKWEPEHKLDLDTRINNLGNDMHEVILRLTLEVRNADQIAFLCEIEQAGIFLAANMEDHQLAHCLGAFCPGILYPYAREAISNITMKASFPPVHLAPVNFDALFMNHLQQQAQNRQNAN